MVAGKDYLIVIDIESQNATTVTQMSDLDRSLPFHLAGVMVS